MQQELRRSVGVRVTGRLAKMDAPLADVVKQDQPKVIDAYQKASENLVASKLEVGFRKVKTGKIVRADMVMVTILSGGHVFVMHFLQES